MKLTQAQSETAAVPIVAEPLLTLEDVSVWYSDSEKAIVQGVDLTVNQGELVLFLGPSGCGKSTLALACAGLIPSAVEGQVTGNLTHYSLSGEKSSAAMVFQDPDVGFCMLQAGDEVAFGLENQRVPRWEMPLRIDQGLSTAGLAIDKTSQHARFSGGMKQKLAIASALVFDAPLLIMDEPTANLDPLSTQTVFQTIRRLKAHGQAMIVIEHKFGPLLPFVDRVVLFHKDGRVRASGDAKTILRQHWEWMIEEGVVPPWSDVPAFLGSNSQTNRSVQDGFQTGAAVPAHLPVESLGLSHLEGGLVVGQALLDAPFVDEPLRDERPMVAFSDVSARFDDKLVWEHLSFTVPSGAFVAVVGPNGSGKSTLLQTMAGLVTPATGAVSFMERPLGEWSMRERFASVSYCFQNPELQFIFERVGDELANEITGSDVPKGILTTLSEFGLEGTHMQSPFSLSQGQKRRLSVAVMLQQEHDLYILDEPTFGQDARTQQFIMEKLSALHHNGKTIVFSTHDMGLVERYATHVLVLGDGHLLFNGSPLQLKSQIAIQRQAHLLADQEDLVEDLVKDLKEDRTENLDEDRKEHPLPKSSVRERTVSENEEGAVPNAFAYSLNPALHLVTIVAIAVVAMFSTSLGSSLALFLLPIILMLIAARMPVSRVLKRYAAFVVFYLLYLLSFVLFSRVPPGEKALHFLWWTVSWYGFHSGLILAFRMLSVAGFGILVLSVSDMTDLIVSLCQTLRVPPKMAYGALAGIRFIPLFRDEWQKLKIARRLRGREQGMVVLRPVRYSLPLLSQAIRMSERVAIAMEARGFVGQAASSPDGRTYFRKVPVRTRDIAYNVCIFALAVSLVLFGNLWQF